MTVAETRDETSIRTIKARDFITKIFFLLTYPVNVLENFLQNIFQTKCTVYRGNTRNAAILMCFKGIFVGETT